MKRVYLKIAGLLLLCFISPATVTAIETSTRCLSCEAIQHAVNLAEIERYLKQGNPQTVAQLDKEAREWFSTFQDGGLLFDGWKDISDMVTNSVPDSEKVQTKLQMLALGVRMGCEWSKENEIRKISTKMLKNWGGEIRKVVREHPADIPHVINKIEDEVDALLLLI